MNFEELYPGTCSSVSVAARLGNNLTLKCLLEKRKASNIQDNRGWRALHHAAASGHVRCVELLLKASDVDVNAITFMRETALHLVCDADIDQKNRFLIAKILLDNGVDPNIEKQNRFKTVLNTAIVKNDPELVKLLLDYKVDVNEVDDLYGSAIDAAVIKGNVEIVKLILKQRLNLNPLRSDKYQFFNTIVDAKDLNLLKVCLKNPQCCRCIDVTRNGSTPLDNACSATLWLEGIELLLDYGANANIRYGDLLPFEKFVLAVTYNGEDEEQMRRILTKLLDSTSKLRLKKTLYDYSIFHDLLRRQYINYTPDSSNKKMLIFINEQTDLKANSFTILNWKLTDEDQEYQTCFHFHKEWHGSQVLLSPLAFFFQLEIWDFDILNLLLKDVENLNDLSEHRTPPLVTASAYCDWSSHREKFVHRLLERGANPCIALNNYYPLPTSLIYAITHNSTGLLEFLLVHAVPAQVFFTSDCLALLRNSYQEIVTFTYDYRRGYCYNEPACYRYLAKCLLSIFRWLRCVDRFLPRLPLGALKLVEMFSKFVDHKSLAAAEVEYSNFCSNTASSSNEMQDANGHKKGVIYVVYAHQLAKWLEEENSFAMEQEIKKANGKNMGTLLEFLFTVDDSEHDCERDIMESSDSFNFFPDTRKLFIATYTSSIDYVRKRVGTIKSLRHLCLLRIRLALWREDRHVPFCDSVRLLAREAKLPPPIENLLLFGAKRESCFNYTT